MPARCQSCSSRLRARSRASWPMVLTMASPYRVIAARQPRLAPSVVVPPRRSAVLSSQADTDPSQRDGHIRFIQEHGRSAWRQATGQGRRSLVETAIGRYNALIGPRLRARDVANQQSEVALGVGVLNRMIRVAKPVSVRIA